MSYFSNLDKVFINDNDVLVSGSIYVLKSNEHCCIAYKDGYLNIVIADGSTGRHFIGLFDKFSDLRVYVDSLFFS